MSVELRTVIPVLDAILRTHAVALGRDAAGYRNHTYRVVNLCEAFAATTPEQLHKTAIAAAFHDLGIWTAHTFDYLAPSVALACTYLDRERLSSWKPEITAMILEHHKISACSGPDDALVDVFRRADWVDVTLGVRRFGLTRSRVAAIRAAWPDEGFHWRLIQLSAMRLLTHPLSPLPMIRR